MNSLIVAKYPLLSFVSLDILEEIEYSDIILEAHTKLEENGVEMF